MAFSPHLRVSFGGIISLGGLPNEIWECNVSCKLPSGGETAADQEAYLGDIIAPLNTWFTAASSGISQDAYLQFVKANQIGPTGAYADAETTHEHFYASGIHGGVAPLHPQIMSLATSWTTGISRGPGAHGRIYLPNYTWGNVGSMLVPADQCHTAAVAGNALLMLLNEPPGGSNVATPIVASKVNGTNAIITGVAVGNILDVQRRRKDAYRESYATVVHIP